MLDFLHEMNQESRINQVRSDAFSAKVDTQEAQRKLVELERKLETTLMVCEALWRIVKKSHKLKDEDLAKWVKQIDEEDGRADGRVKKSAPIKCSNCGKTVQRGKTKCMYCGQEHEVSPFKR